MARFEKVAGIPAAIKNVFVTFMHCWLDANVSNYVQQRFFVFVVGTHPSRLGASDRAATVVLSWKIVI